MGGEPRASEKLVKGGSVSAQERHQAELQQCVSGSGPHTPEKTFRILEGSSLSEHSTVREALLAQVVDVRGCAQASGPQAARGHAWAAC